MTCPRSGQLMFNGKNIYAATFAECQHIRRRTPNGVPKPLLVLNSQMRVGEIIMEPMAHLGSQKIGDRPNWPLNLRLFQTKREVRA